MQKQKSRGNPAFLLATFARSGCVDLPPVGDLAIRSGQLFCHHFFVALVTKRLRRQRFYVTTQKITARISGPFFILMRILKTAYLYNKAKISHVLYYPMNQQ